MKYKTIAKIILSTGNRLEVFSCTVIQKIYEQPLLCIKVARLILLGTLMIVNDEF